MQVFKHIRSEGLYEYLGEAFLESTLEKYVMYRAVRDGKVWLRPHNEFFDGRFEEIAPLSSLDDFVKALAHARQLEYDVVASGMPIGQIHDKYFEELDGEHDD